MRKALALGCAVVLVLVGLTVAVLTLPWLGAAVSSRWFGADWFEAKTSVIEIKYALEDYRVDHGRYPTADEGLRALLAAPPDRAGPRFFSDGYLLSEETLVDPWDRPIIYQPGQTPDEGCLFYSLGRDGARGGTGADEDIVETCTPSL